MSKHDQAAPASDVAGQPNEKTNGQPPIAPTGNPPQRDPMGRFLPGNGAGQGNPFGRTMASRRTAIMSAVNEEKLMEIMMVMVGLALQGDVGAAKLVFQYAAGKPVPMVDPDRVELDEWDICRESVVKSDDMKMVREGVTAKVANLLTVMIRVLNETENVEAIGRQILGTPEERLAKQSAKANGAVPRADCSPVKADGEDREGDTAATLASESSRASERSASNPTGEPSRRAGSTGGQAARGTGRTARTTDDFDRRTAEGAEILSRRPLESAIGEPVAAPSKCGSNGGHPPSKSRSNGQKRRGRKVRKNR